ncbi:hypothetical protein L7F22_011064 [Adiantum nelumboides]|nr:hypothetical protein [Adiantum nelumboides]
MADNNKENRMSIDYFDFAHEDANDDTPMLVNYLVTRLQQSMSNPALQGKVQQQLHAYGILPPFQQERGPERSHGETSKRGLSIEKGVENPYQELNQLLEGKPSSKKKDHVSHEGSPSKEREENKSQDESMEDVAPRRRRAQRPPTPTKRKRSPHSPHHRESKIEEKNSKKKKERKRSPSSPSSSPSSSSDESSGYSSQEKQRRGHQRSYAAWKRSCKLKKFKEEGKNISFLTYDGTFGATDKVLAFIQQFDAAFGDEGYTESSKLCHVAMHFQKSARQWWASLRGGDTDDGLEAGEEKKEPQPLDIEEKKEPKVEPDIEKPIADVQVDHEEVETGEESMQEQKVANLEESGGAQSEIQVETKEVPNNNWEMQAKESQEEKEKVEGEEHNPDEEVGSEEEPRKEGILTDYLDDQVEMESTHPGLQDRVKMKEKKEMQGSIPGDPERKAGQSVSGNQKGRDLQHPKDQEPFRMQNAANECQIQELMEQVQEKTLQSEQLCQMEASRNSLAEKLHGQQSQLRSTKNELETMKLELAGKKVELENEKLAKPTMIQALNANAVKLKNQRGRLSSFATALDCHKMAVNECLANRLHCVEGD